MGRSNQEILMDLIIKAMEAGKKVGDKKMPKKNTLAVSTGQDPQPGTDGS